LAYVFEYSLNRVSLVLDSFGGVFYNSAYTWVCGRKDVDSIELSPTVRPQAGMYTALSRLTIRLCLQILQHPRPPNII